MANVFNICDNSKIVEDIQKAFERGFNVYLSPMCTLQLLLECDEKHNTAKANYTLVFKEKDKFLGIADVCNRLFELDVFKIKIFRYIKTNEYYEYDSESENILLCVPSENLKGKFTDRKYFE